jgi:hypothetical protein
MHDFFGARQVESDSTVETLRASGTSCQLSADSAGYWFPMLSEDGVQVQPKHVFVYYRAPQRRTVQAYPSGHGIVAGGDTRIPPAPEREQLSLSWACADTGPFSAQPMDCGSKKLKAHVHFPDCWSGIDAGPNVTNEMTFSDSGSCPADHPINMPKLTLHVTYQTKDGTGATLSSDMGQPNGTQLHADFLNAWDQGVLEFLVETCLNQGRECKQMTDSKLTGLGYTPAATAPGR